MAKTAGKETVTLLLQMKNPSNLIKQERQANILAQHARCAQYSRAAAALKLRARVSNEEQEVLTSDDDEEDQIKIKIKLFYYTQPINSSYNQKLSVYVNLAKRQYVLLIMANCQEWAKSLVSYFSTIFINKEKYSDMVDFCVNEVNNILTTNGITSHKIFNSCYLSRKDVMALGLSLGVVTLLFDCVHHCEKQVAQGECLV
ncbi:hypothetical protein VP01_2858g4 [Puccinia sorghi]|uniref:Uncharacterized protein n=1 Tax=Puccinia sorghi TaxID=27349 RepID=A0A0L6V2Q2_9BASI|nr:hypothetical protein VP01_2858g4 [Puccinia sorghi]